MPPYDRVADLIITKDGIWYDDDYYGNKLVLTVDKDVNSRGITMKRTNGKNNWIDLVARSLNNEIMFTSITYEGETE